MYSFECLYVKWWCTLIPNEHLILVLFQTKEICLVETNEAKILSCCFNFVDSLLFIDVYCQKGQKTTEEAEAYDTTEKIQSQKSNGVLEYYDDNNTLQKVKPQQSSWKYFPFKTGMIRLLQILEFVKDSCNDKWFPQCKKHNAAGKLSSLLKLIFLVSLRYIRGWTVVDIEETTAIFEETHRQSFRAIFLLVVQYLLFR
jgi:hypothetical protein